MSTFTNKYTFNEKYKACLGAEEELWLTDSAGRLVPKSLEIFANFEEGRLKPELPIHQIESVTGICHDVLEIEHQLQENRNQLFQLSKQHDFTVSTASMPPSDFDVRVYPKKRYLELFKKHGESLRPGWILGLHAHVGCASFEEAINLMNYLREYLPFFFWKSLRNQPTQRLESYGKMCENFVPPYVESLDMFEELAHKEGFQKDPKDCWWTLRINPIGTVEVRICNMQSTAAQSAEIVGLIQRKANDVLHHDIKQTKGTASDEMKSHLFRIAQDPSQYDRYFAKTRRSA